MEAVEGPVLERAELLAIGDGLVKAWFADDGRVLQVRAKRLQNNAHAPSVNALSAHAHHLGRAALTLIQGGALLEAMPTVRATYECAITAQYLAVSTEGIAAFINTERRHRRNLAQSMSKAVSRAFVDEHDQIDLEPVPEQPTSADPQLRSFEQMAQSLVPGRGDIYVLYRMMSEFTHPTVHLVDHYVTPDDNHPLGITIRSEAEPLKGDVWVFILVSSLLWAASAIDGLDMNRPRRSELRATARRLRVADHLQLTAEALERERLAEQTRRRSAWKGPKRRR